MLIYLLRHGIAEQRSLSDQSRELSREGVMQTRSVAEKFQIYQPRIERVLMSPLQRAKQTATMMRVAIPDVRYEIADNLVPDANVYEVLDSLEKLRVHSVLLVSHNPFLSNFLSLLIDGTLESSRPFEPSHMYCIEMDFIAPGCGKIVYTLTP